MNAEWKPRVRRISLDQVFCRNQPDKRRKKNKLQSNFRRNSGYLIFWGLSSEGTFHVFKS